MILSQASLSALCECISKVEYMIDWKLSIIEFVENNHFDFMAHFFLAALLFPFLMFLVFLAPAFLAGFFLAAFLGFEADFLAGEAAGAGLAGEAGFTAFGFLAAFGLAALLAALGLLADFLD